MASESAFNKRLTEEETKMDKVEGLLEHFNLPPKVIDFIRANQRIIQIAIAIVVVAVVFGSLYGSYREKIQEESSSALAAALQAGPDTKANELLAVVDKYGSSSSALWARVELAHLDMKNGSFAEASMKYEAILPNVKSSNPLYPLVLFSLAQSLEGDNKFQESFSKYDLLKDIKGYENLAYVGMGRLEEAQGNIDKAISIYNNYILSMGDEPSFSQARSEINAKVARLKARQ